MLQHPFSKHSSMPKYPAGTAKSMIPFRCATLVISPFSPTSYRLSLLGWSLESLRNLRLPAQPILPKDLRCNREFLRSLEQAGSHNDLVAEYGLVVVDVRGAIGTVVAVDGVALKRVNLRLCGWERKRGREVPESPL